MENYKADCWSLGLILHYLCAQSAAFTGLSEIQIRNKVLSGYKGKIPKIYSPFCDLIILRLVEQDPNKRASYDEIA